jgi:hypothetical protein
MVLKIQCISYNFDTTIYVSMQFSSLKNELVMYICLMMVFYRLKHVAN